MTGDRPVPQSLPGLASHPAGKNGEPGAYGSGLEQAFDARSLYLLRAAVAAHAADTGLSQSRVSEVVIAAHELAANAVRHGGGHGRLRLWVDGPLLVCQISDEGPARSGHDGSQQQAPGDATSWPRLLGHGLWVTDQVADQFSVACGPGGTTATAAFSINRPPPEPGAPATPAP
jgi:anti-sigma regulatory factor (Ser/Thr protein kinase)